MLERKSIALNVGSVLVVFPGTNLGAFIIHVIFEFSNLWLPYFNFLPSLSLLFKSSFFLLLKLATRAFIIVDFLDFDTFLS